MTPQQEIIERIRRDTFQIGSEISVEVKKGIKPIIAMLNRSLKKLAEDLYTKETHFVLELIQNADDNEYKNPELSLLRFNIDEEKILVQNNELGFSKDNVERLCDVGNSSKNKNLGYIGEKGIGFKSVFRITDEPQVFSNGFRFKFEKTNDNDRLGYIVPHWIDILPDFIDENLTNILLPLKEEAKEHLPKFNEIEPELLLFLQKLSRIEIYNASDGSTNKYRRSYQNGLVKIENANNKNYYKIISKVLQVPETIQEENRQLKETKLILGFPVNEDGTSLINPEQKIFAFLPTRSYGFKFIIQADFLVPTSREDIHKDKKWNKWLRDNVANVFLKSVEKFKADEKLRTSFYNYIPLSDEIKDSYFSVAVKQLHKVLINSECILTESQKWLKPSNVFRASEDIRSLITNESLKTFFDKEYILAEVEKNTAPKILDTLGIQNFTVDNLIEFLKESDWVNNQEEEWFVDLYCYLEKQPLGKQRLERIKKLKIIKLASNELASPSEKKIFFPLKKRHSYGFEKRIPFINKKLIPSENKELSARIEKFLESIAVFKPQPFEIIENYIFPDYESDDWKQRDKELLLGYVRYIKDNLNDYKNESDRRLNLNKPVWAKVDALKRLKEAIWILYKKEDNWYSKPKDLYLSKEYSENKNLESLFSGINGIRFIHGLYINSSIESIKLSFKKKKESKKKIKEKISEVVKEWNEFFLKIGVENKPRIVEKDELKNHWTSGYSHYQRSIKKFSSADMISILNQRNKEKNNILAKFLDSNWDFYKDYTKWTDYNFYYEWRSLPVESDWFVKIKNIDWISATDGTLEKPSSLFLDKPTTRELLGENVKYLALTLENQDFIQSLSINKDANVETVLRYLKKLVEDNSSDKIKFIKFYTFLDNNFDKNENIINSNFTENDLIYIPETVEKYTTTEKVLWKDVSKIFGDQRFYLDKHYSNLKNFFVGKLGINEKPTPRDYADVLCEITDKKPIEKNDEEKILNIYKELNNFLKPENSEFVISNQDWWADFIKKGIFWTNKLEFWRNDEDVFVNDDEELYKLFEGKPKVSFLKIPYNYHPKLQDFIKSAGIPYLSQKVIAHPPLIKESTPYEKLTEELRYLFKYIVRYLYFYENSIYEKSKEDKRLSNLRNIFCYGVDKLQISYTLNEESGVNEKSHYLDENKLFVNLDFLENYSRIAIEIARIFENPKGLSDFIYSLFLLPNFEAIENYLTDRNIRELPEDEMQILNEITNDDSSEILSLEILNEDLDFSEPDSEFVTGDILPDSFLSDENEFESNEVDESDEPENEEDENEISTDNPKVNFSNNPNQSNSSNKSKKAKKNKESKNQDGKDQSIQNDEWEAECSPENAAINIVEPNFKEPLTISIADSETQGDFSRDTDEDSTSNGSKEGDSKNPLSHTDKRKIGRWGEKYSIQCIKNELSKKYQNGKIVETATGFDISTNNQKVASVFWLNKNDDLGVGYDIRIKENAIETFIEVKSTKTEFKDILQISGTQWALAHSKQENFYIYRVYNAGTDRARLEKLCDPSNLLRKGYITAQSITLKI